MSNWEPIETAPKDGSVILLCWPFGDHVDGPHIETGSWMKLSGYAAHWCRAGKWTPGLDPTHWMPLPAPPKETAR
jgi:hypothetical protein